MDLNSLKFIGAGLCAIAMLGSSLGVGKIFSSLLEALARNPSAEKELMRSAFIGAGLAEAMGLFGFVIALILALVV